VDTRSGNVEVFHSALGWMAIVGCDGRLRLLTFGHESPQAARRAAEASGFDNTTDRKWNTCLAERLQAYAAGQAESFRDVPLDVAGMSRFQRAVVVQCQRVRWGTTVSYGQLAANAGFPQAARAVGNVMARNRVPLIVPCHRVVATARGLGGYSAPQGIAMKRRLLQLEGAVPELWKLPS